MTGREQRPQANAADLDHLLVGEFLVGLAVRVGQVPQHQVGGVQEDRRPDRIGELRRLAHVVIVRVRAQHRQHPAVTDQPADRLDIVRRVDDHAFPVIADHPCVVVDVEGLTVQRERARRGRVVDAHCHQKTTTERSTSPRCIFSNACSTWSSAISSLTNFSSGSRPCW